MYPVLRLIKEQVKFRHLTLDLFATHVSHHICWPWDIDPWMELNNGRTLTLFDLGRMPLTSAIGINRALMRHRWGMAVAGASVRYRRRIRAFHRFEMRSRLLGWDRRFFYVEQTMWRKGEALNHVLIRLAATDENGILAPERLVEALGQARLRSPALPGWVTAWAEADALRPWPPMQG
ncbi:MAG: acyl-CoA thioesterase [Pararhodobacter sp.]